MSCPELTTISAINIRPSSRLKRSCTIHVSEAISDRISGLRPLILERIEEEAQPDPLLKMIDALATFEENNQPQPNGLNLFADATITSTDENGPRERWRRVFKHIGEFKNNRNANAPNLAERSRPMTSFRHIISHAMQRKGDQSASDSIVSAKPALLTKRATFSGGQHMKSALQQQQSHSFAAPSMQSQAMSIAHLVETLQAMRQMQTPVRTNALRQPMLRYNNVFTTAVGVVHWKNRTRDIWRKPSPAIVEDPTSDHHVMKEM